MLPQSGSAAVSSAASNRVQKHWPVDDIDQPTSIRQRAQYVQDALRHAENGKSAINPSASGSKWANRPVTVNSYAESVSTAALHSSQSKETWRSIALEAVKKSTKGSNMIDMPVKAAGGQESSKEEAESSGEKELAPEKQ